MRFKIADMILEFQGDPDMESSALWDLFRTDETQSPHYRILRRYCTELPQCAEGHYFYDGVQECHYAMSREVGNQLELLIPERLAPWGSKIHQLYELMALPHVLLQEQRLVIHASYIAHEGYGMIFTAPSGTGKSTQADLWQKYRNAEILNGDRGVIGMREEEPYVFGFPMSGSSEYCVNRSLPLRCIVSLKQAPENRIRRLTGREALRVILNGTYADPKHPGDFSRSMNVAISLLQTPVFELSCLPNVGAVEALEQALEQLTP